jgi:hypothetical protein
MGGHGEKGGSEEKKGIVVPFKRQNPITTERLVETPKKVRDRLKLACRNMERQAGFHIGVALLDPPSTREADTFMRLVQGAIDVLGRSPENKELPRAVQAKVGIRLDREKGSLGVRVGRWEGNEWNAGYSEFMHLADDERAKDELADMVRKCTSRWLDRPRLNPSE